MAVAVINEDGGTAQERNVIRLAANGAVSRYHNKSKRMKTNNNKKKIGCNEQTW